ncbi:MAG: CDP-glycerol glycerophosphotransferase family protein [Methanobacterium sp.]|uniref:CDP-glycerol glycerophosphotransferase family protein n=1 Tax=Methanobacterium sp. TaxID=2164 RepID=UPI00155A6553|nr:CDP-glycerol glycerophosphotransferase family protein [uncultured Methanobacterium sp.]
MIPKDESRIVFSSQPDFTDNPKALFEYLSKEYNGTYKLIWAISGDFNHYEGLDVFSRHGLKGLLEIFRSKFIITSHNDFEDICSSNQVLVNLWHGMPLKGMGYLDNFVDEKQLKDIKKGWEVDDVVIATSPLMKLAFTACVGRNPRKIYVTGQPRNDKLFLENGQMNLSELLGFDVSKYNKIILYCPTYRVWHDRIDGNPKNEDIFDFEDFDESKFMKYLIDNDILFLLKLHPAEEKLYLSKFKSNENIRILTSEMFLSKFLDLYDILNSVDMLITDYSSVYFDFLLLDRPILFTPTDIQEYSRRGFALEPYDFWAPGPKVCSQSKLMEELEKFNDNPNYYQKERNTINELVNIHKDGNSSKRVWNLIKKMV